MVGNVGDDGSTLNQRSDQNERGEEICLTDQLSNGEREVDPLWHNLARSSLQVRELLAVRAGVSGDVGADPQAERYLLVEGEERLPAQVWLVGRSEDCRNALPVTFACHFSSSRSHLRLPKQHRG